MKILNMVCSVLAKSEYIEGCDIMKFGEGCEKCVPFDWTPIIRISFIFIILLIFVIYYLRELKNRRIKNEHI